MGGSLGRLVERAGSLDFFSRGHPRAVLVDAEPKVVERMVERSQRPGDVKQFRVGVGRDPGGHARCFGTGGRIFRDFSGRMNSWKSVSEKLSYLAFLSKPIHKVLRLLNPKTKS